MTDSRKAVAVMTGAILLSSFLLFIFGYTSYLHFLAVAVVAAVIAYRILPRIR